jgi:integrase
LHDLRHTFCTRLAEDPALTLVEVQTAMRHRSIAGTLRYWQPRLDSLIDKVQQHYARPAPVPRPAPGYAPDDMRTVFGG